MQGHAAAFLAGSREEIGVNKSTTTSLMPVPHASSSFDVRVFLVQQVLGDSALLELATGCDSSLVQLDLSSCSFVTDAALLASLLKCPFLSDLTLSGCAQISDQVLFSFAHSCRAA